MKKLRFLLLLALFCAVFSIALCANPVISVCDGEETYYSNDQKFYLPSCLSRENVSLHVEGENVTFINENREEVSIISDFTVDLTKFKLSNKSNNEAYQLAFKEGGIRYTFTFYFANRLPSVYVTTTTKPGQPTRGWEDDNVKVYIRNSENETIYLDNSLSQSEMKVRGNTTPDYYKVPFQIKLGEKSNLFGLGKAKTWILLANYLDQSLLRNNLMYSLAGDLGMDASSFQNVDLYVDGNYLGIYMLCEKVQIGKNRVDIFDLEKENDKLNSTYSAQTTKVTTGTLIDSSILKEYRYSNDVVNPADITGGYLIELDTNNYRNERCYFITENNNAYVVKSPEYCSKEQMEYIAKLFADMEEAMYSQTGRNRYNKHYSEYIDVDSLAYAYIMQEYGRNYDTGGSSMYFYKDRGVDKKIVKGPLWDCDNTLGNILKWSAAVQEGYWAKDRAFWCGITQHDDFMALVKEKFAIAYDIIYDYVDRGGLLDELLKELGTSVYMEQRVNYSYTYSKWPTYSDGTHYDKWQSSPVFKFIDTYSDGEDTDATTTIGYLIQCMTDRAEWLREEWDCDVTPRTRQMTIPAPTPPPEESTSDESTSDESTSATESSSTVEPSSESTKETTSETSSVSSKTESSTETSTKNAQKSQPDNKKSVLVGFGIGIVVVLIYLGFSIKKRR